MTTFMQPGDFNTSVMDQQVEDLKERMRLLQQDRRANLELLESSKVSNTEEVRHLREENKELKVRLTKLQKRGVSSQADVQVLSNVKKEVLAMRTEYDNLKVQSSRGKIQLRKLADETQIFELESTRPNQDDTPFTRQIRKLENRLDKAMIKYNEAQSIRRTYEHIIKRLKEERISYDTQLQALERTLQSKQTDYDELLLLSADANHARDVAHQELQTERILYNENRSKRDAELRERQQLVKVRKQMVERQTKREARRREIIEKQRLQDELASSNSLLDGACSAADAAALEENERKIDIYETAFRKIKAATGVSDVNEVIRKVSGQENTSASLISLTRNNQENIEQYNIRKKHLRKTIEDTKYSNNGNTQKQAELEHHQKKLSSEIKQMESQKIKYERLNSVFINVKTGTKHLQDKLDLIRQDFGVNAIQFTDSTVVSVLESFETVLQHILSKIKDSSDISLLMNTGLDHSHSYKHDTQFDPIDSFIESEIQENRPYNQRIKIPTLGEDDDGIKPFDPLNDDGMNIDIDDDECDLSRDRIKRFSSQILMSEIKKSKQKSNEHK